MKKYFPLYLLLYFILTFNIYAAFLKDVPQTLKQPDGTILNCFATGDEFFNWLHDSDGYTIIQNTENGWYVYANLINDELIPTNLIPGRDNPQSKGLRPWMIYSEQKIQSFRVKFTVPEKYQRQKQNKETFQSSANKGVLNNIAIFIRFSDEEGFKQNLTYFDVPYNAKNQVSVYDYYWELSYNQLEIKTHFYPNPQDNIILSYQDPYPRSYYKKYNAVSAPNGYKNDNERTVREMTLIKNAVDYVKSSIPTDLDLDFDNDGYVDNVAFIVTGGPEGWADLLWPHMWALYYYDVRINGNRVWNFNFLLANWFDASVLSHEMFHTLGAPDLYRYYVSGTPVGYWDIMSNNLRPPQYSSVYMRYKYGKWIDDIPEINTSGWYELNPSSMKYGSAYKIRSKNYPTEFFIIEYRKREGKYDISLPSGGLLVWRINSNYNGNAGGPPDEIYVYRLDGTSSSWGDISKATFAAEHQRTKINNYSTNPKPFLTDGSLGGLNISNVGTQGTTIRFRVNFPPKTPILSLPSNNSDGIELNPTFVWENTENADYYTLEISDKQDFSDIIFVKDSIYDTSYKLPIELNFLEKYYWRIKANSFYEEPYSVSSVWSFNTSPEPPVINSYSKPQVLCFNDDFSISVNVEGRVTQFQWFKDGEPISGANQPLLTRKNINYHNSAIYYCRVTNYPGKDTVYSGEIPLYVVTKTEVITHPTDQYANINGSVNFTFKVHVNGKESKNYTSIQWYRNNLPINDNDKYAGTKSDILNVNHISPDDYNAEFKAEIIGLCGEKITTNIAKIKQLPDQQSIEYTIDICNNQDIKIIFDSDNLDTTSIEIVNLSNYNITKSNEKFILEFNYNSLKDNFFTINYRLPDINYVYKILYYKINPNDIPILNYTNNHLNLEEGQTLNLTFDILNNQNVSIDWYIHNNYYITTTEPKLIVDNVKKELSGNWYATVSNNCGKTKTEDFIVNISEKSQITNIKDDINNLIIRPNPANNYITISSNYIMNSITLYDLLGNKIYHTNTNDKIVNIDLNSININSGIYFITINTCENLIQRKIQVVK